MSVFFGPLPGSAVATVSQLRGWMRSFAEAGVYPDGLGIYTGSLLCTSPSGLDVSVAPGEAIVDGVYYTHSVAQIRTLSAADTTDPRVDLVVLRLDPAGDGTVSVAVKAGTPDASPVPPAVTRSATGIFEVPLATARVNAGSAVVNVLTDVRTSVPAADQPGDMKMTARATPTDGWLLCQGQTISRATYAALFDAIGTSYGAGDGSTSFDLPDLRTRFPVGVGSGHALGSTGGAQTVTLTEAQMPSHDHGGPSHNHSSGSLASNSNGSHSHTTDVRKDANNDAHNHNSTAERTQHASTSGENATNTAIQSAGTHTHTISGSTASSGTGSTGSAGSGAGHENRPPYVAINYMIRT